MPKLHNLYWMCSRCGHRWKKPPVKSRVDNDIKRDKFSGDFIHEVLDCCPQCGSKYNVRHILDAGIGHPTNGGTDKALGNYDPWTEEEIAI